MNDNERPESAEELQPEVDESQDESAELVNDVERLEQELDEHRDRLLRTVAEMDNLRKRTRREVSDSRRFAQADLLRPLLEVLDNFDRALDHAPDHAPDQGDGQQFHQGVALIAQSFRQVLTDRGVRLIEAEGSVFDPALHEAVGQAPATDEAPSGTVVAVVQPGYTLDDMVLRASRVIVAQ